METLYGGEALTLDLIILLFDFWAIAGSSQDLLPALH